MNMMRSAPTSYLLRAGFPNFSGLRPLLGTVPSSKAYGIAPGELNGSFASATLLRRTYRRSRDPFRSIPVALRSCALVSAV
jgi:hypothetical protein